MKFLLYISIFVSILINISAQDSLRSYTLDEITVSDNSSIEAIPSVLYAKDSIKINEDLRVNSKPVLDVIRTNIPAMFVTGRSNLGYGISTGAAGGVTIRGIGASPNTRVLLLVDGNPQFMGLMGHPLPDSYSSDELKEVQVINGPASAIYGSGAMGGVINLITGAPAKEGAALSLSSGYGSFNTMKYAGQLQYGTADFKSSFSYKNESTDGDRENSDFDNNSYSLNLDQRLNNNYSIRLSSSVDDYRVYDPGTVTSPYENSYADVVRGIVEAGISDYFAKHDGRLSVFYNFGDHEITDGFRSNDYNIGGRFFQNFQLSSANTTSFGLDFTSFGGEAKNILSDLDYGSHSVSQFGFYVNTTHRFNNLVQFTGTLRYDHNSQFGSEFTPQAGFNFMLSPKFNTKVFVSKGYRNPTIRELYLFPAPTPDLEPEELWNYEIDMDYKISNHFITDLNLYYMEGSNLIQTAGMWPNMTLSNSGDFINKGLEASIKYRSGSFYNVKLAASVIDPDKVTASFPQQTVTGIVDFAYNQFYSMLSIEHNRDIYGADNFQQKLDNFTLVNIDCTYDIISNLVVGASVKNLLDEDYEILPGYPMPGVSFYGNVKLRLSLLD